MHKKVIVFYLFLFLILSCKSNNNETTGLIILDGTVDIVFEQPGTFKEKKYFVFYTDAVKNNRIVLFNRSNENKSAGFDPLILKKVKIKGIKYFGYIGSSINKEFRDGILVLEIIPIE